MFGLCRLHTKHVQLLKETGWGTTRRRATYLSVSSNLWFGFRFFNFKCDREGSWLCDLPTGPCTREPHMPPTHQCAHRCFAPLPYPPIHPHHSFCVGWWFLRDGFHIRTDRAFMNRKRKRENPIRPLFFRTRWYCITVETCQAYQPIDILHGVRILHALYFFSKLLALRVAMLMRNACHVMMERVLSNIA